MMLRRELPSRGRGVEDGLAARLYDPLWLLARQWQFGEFRHENAASPALVEVTTEVHRLDRWRAGSEGEWQDYDPAAVPLERLVEEHGGGPSPRLRLEGGLRLARALRAGGTAGDVAAFAGRCPFPRGPDAPLADATDAMLRADLPDGAALEACLLRLAAADSRAAELEQLRAHGEVGTAPARLGELAAEWLAWWQAEAPAAIPAAQDCWDEHRLEHAFALAADSLPATELRATEYAGGRLDWSAVDAFGADGAGGRAPERIPQRGVPAPARFGGMPAPRFWEMEDARFDPGAVDAAPIDLGRLMLIGYATVYGNDWFVVPVRTPVASLSRIASFVVHDVFGGTTELSAVAADQDNWNLFGLSQAEVELEPGQERPTSPWFFLPPSLPDSLEGPPTDIAMLFRDEMANLAWAVEATVRDDQGRPRDRFAEWSARGAPEPAAGETPAYRVVNEVPKHWFPLLPERFESHESVRLWLVPLTRQVGEKADNPEPRGELLRLREPWLYEEEVPRSGSQVTRSWQYARWHDGSRHLWQARRKATGGGEGSSGLRFDRIENPKEDE